MRVPIGRAFGVLAERAPDAVAVRCGEVVLTRAELDAAGNRLARSWAGRVGVDDVVSISLPNGVDLLLACVAAWKLGATPAPVSPRLPEPERRALLAAASPALVVDAPLDLPGGDASPLPDAVARSWKAPTSSGSTGTPRLLRDPHPSLVDVDAPVAPFVPRRAVQLVSGPLFHAAPFVYALRGLMTGHELVVMPRFDAGEALAAIERHRVTWAVLVPTTMQRIWRHPARIGTDVSSLESVLHLGARCPERLKRDWIGWLGAERVVEVYAGTEAQGLTMIRGDEWLARPGSVGRPLPGSRFRVGEGGLLEMQRDGGLPGWHTLGDIGRIDPDGHVHVDDRADDVVVTGGAKVHPADVEAVLDAHPSVRSSVVVPRPHPDLGQAVHAVVDADPWDEAALRAWVGEHLDPEKRPRTYERSPRELRDDTGKARRRDWR